MKGMYNLFLFWYEATNAARIDDVSIYDTISALMRRKSIGALIALRYSSILFTELVERELNNR